MQGSILQVSISPGGVPNRAIPEGDLHVTGFAGDSWRDRRIHGGPNQAVLLLTSEGLDELKALGFPLFPGALGENLTTTGLDRRQFRLGMRLRAGLAVIELTKMRAPCRTLDVYGKDLGAAVFDPLVKAGNPDTPRWGLAGFYARVVTPGVVRPGDPIALLDLAV
jgi:MOSC domain-containing protein YiiM